MSACRRMGWFRERQRRPSLGLAVENDRVDVAGTVHDADNNQVLVRHPEIRAIRAERVPAQARP